MSAAENSSDGDDGLVEFPSAYGQYLLLHRLARGGMGNVFLAKTGGVMGIEKHCVVKTLRHRFTHDPEYVKRFMQEARFVVQLTHRNICPVFDVGRVHDSYYLAMELIVGRDVRSLLNALTERGQKLPRGLALHIGGEILDALDYAHRHSDNTTGQALHIVHRDVSPQNVMINVEGEVKLIDFGLAESGHVAGDTVDGEQQQAAAATVMGKMSYMAPEHARGEPVDARADQFSAAVLIYELLTGHRYYEGLTSEQVWQQAGAGQFKPAGIAELPRKLRDVLEKALAANREERHLTCGDFRDALLAYARQQNLHAGTRELRTLMGELFANDLREMRELLQRFAHVNNNPAFADTTLNDATNSDDVFQIAGSAALRTAFQDPTELVARSGAYPIPPSIRPPKASRAPLVAAAALVIGAAAAVAAGFALGYLPPRAPPPVVATVPPPVAPPVVATPTTAPPTTAPPTTAPPTTAPPTTAPPTTAPTVADAGVVVDEEPAAATGGAKHVVKGKTSPPKGEKKEVTFGDKKDFVIKHCGSIACAQKAKEMFPKLGDLTLDQTQAFKKELNVCYELCKNKR